MMKVLATVVVVSVTTLLFAGPAAAGRHDKACVAEVRAAGDWGKNVNPGKATFVSGTEGRDRIAHIEPGVVFCGLGGDDYVVLNEGWFYGGAGVDTVERNLGTTNGGTQTDVVLVNHGVFVGGPDVVLDAVHFNHGFFDGGPGTDLVQDLNMGTCINVEQGCNAQ